MACYAGTWARTEGQEEGIGCSGRGIQGGTGPQLSRDLPVVVGVAVSPKLPILMGPCGGAPAVAQPRDMHVSLSLLLVSAP